METGSEIRRARAREAGALTGIAVRAKAAWGYGEDFMARARAELTVSVSTIRKAPVFVLESDSSLRGFYGLTVPPASSTDNREVEIAFLFVEPEDFGRGYGALLWRHAATEAAKLGTRLIVESDPNAAGFYRRMGMTASGQRISSSTGRTLPMLNLDLRTIAPSGV